MGPVFNIPVNMQFLLSASLLAVASAYYPLVTFPNGAVTPFDVTNPVGTYSQAGIPLHHIGKREAQYPLVTFPNGAVTPFDVNNPVGTYSQAGIPAGVHIAYGKRSAEPQLVAFPNGAVTPFDHANPWELWCPWWLPSPLTLTELSSPRNPLRSRRLVLSISLLMLLNQELFSLGPIKLKFSNVLLEAFQCHIKIQ